MNTFEINSYIKAIDNGNVDEIKLIQNNESVNDIVYEIYKKGLLTTERLQFIVKNDNIFKVTSSLLKQLLKDNKLRLLDIIFNNFKFFDTDCIIKLILIYKNNIPKSTVELNKLINNYSISTEKDSENIFYYEHANCVSCVYLINACKSGKIGLVKYLIEHGADINKEGINGETPFFYACSSGNENLVKYLIEKKGADINKENRSKGETPLFNACSSGNENLVKYLIEQKGVDMNKENDYGETPLFNACHSGKENLVKYLIEQKQSDINKESKYGATPLFNACSSGNEILVKYLIEQKQSDINKENNAGITPLFNACSTGNEILVKYLVEKGADVNKVNKFPGTTPLFNACSSGNENLVKYLIEQKGADINKVSNKGITPIFNACLSGNENLVKYLIGLGADINKECISGETPLFYACSGKNEDLVKYLIEEKGADINKENDYGQTSLFDACESGNENIVKYLIENGADINKENERWETPIFSACLSRNENLIKYLIEQGADLNREDEEGETVLSSVYSWGNEKLMKYIIEYDTNIDINEELLKACKNINEDLVKYLIENGADINIKNDDDETPLSLVYGKNENLMKYLIEYGTKINNEYINDELTIALENDHENLAKYLIEHEAIFKKSGILPKFTLIALEIRIESKSIKNIFRRPIYLDYCTTFVENDIYYCCVEYDMHRMDIILAIIPEELISHLQSFELFRILLFILTPFPSRMTLGHLIEIFMGKCMEVKINVIEHVLMRSMRVMISKILMAVPIMKKLVDSITDKQPTIAHDAEAKLPDLFKNNTDRLEIKYCTVCHSLSTKDIYCDTVTNTLSISYSFNIMNSYLESKDNLQ
ncbi:ankyrin repeat-containing domain protein [Neocallimastix sp. 'constans']